MLEGLTQDKMQRLKKVHSSAAAYDVVKEWYFFGRYAAFMFLECYYNVFKPQWVDNIKFKGEPEENYTKGAVLITRSRERGILDKFLECAKKDTKDNAFAIETSLCAVEKIKKGTRWDGYYTERAMKEARESREFGDLMRKCCI